MTRTGDDIFAALLVRARPLIFGSLLLGVLAVMMGILLVQGLRAHVEGTGTGWMIIQFLSLLSLAATIRLLQSRLAARSARRLALEFRTRLARRMLTVPYARLGEVDRNALRRALTEGPRTIMQSVRVFDTLPPQIAQQVAGVGFIAWYAPELLPLLLGAIACVFAAWLWVFRRTQADERSRVEAEGAVMRAFDDLLTGFTEIKLNPARRDYIVEGVIATRVEAACIERRAARRSVSLAMVLAELTLLFTAAALIIVGPLVFGTDPILAVGAGFLVLYIRVGMLAETPQIVRMLETVRGLSDWQARLEQAAQGAQGLLAPPERPATLKHGVVIEAVRFDYPAPAGFALGPLDAVIAPGTVVFLVGANGSGKTTLLKLLTGLYAPDDGRVLIDGTARAAYGDSGWFSALFPDSQAPPHPAPQQVAARLAAIEAPEAASRAPVEPRWAALAAMEAENRPVLIFDEWAADQPAAFGRWFYTRYLPLQKRRGKTVFVATHDAQYFSTADRVLLLEDGKIS